MGTVDEKAPLPPPRKYVSVFRINGEPILPPLMTAEKRGEMRKFKEKAILIEQRLRKPKQHDQRSENTTIDAHLPKSLHNLSQQSLENDDCRFKESAAESVEFLKKVLQSQQEEDKSNETIRNVCDYSSFFSRNKGEEKLKKLGKSETLIYDNSTNELIKIPKEKEMISTDNHQKQLNPDNLPIKPPSHLLLAGTTAKGISSIPSICLNPPTPLTADKSLCSTLSGTESTDSAITSVFPSQSLDFSYELSSDESYNNIITHGDENSRHNLRRNNTRLDNEEDESLNSAKEKLSVSERSVCAKIQQFEAINSPQTNNEKIYKNRKLCLGTPSGTMNRSATSPSLKINANNRSSSYRSQSLTQDSHNSPESNLVRSSSFTLDTPSKALIEHMQQQKVINEAKTAIKSHSNTISNLAGKSTPAPIRAHRDTVESKAKKVQKMEFKSSRPTTQLKITPSKLTRAAALPTSPYSTRPPTHHTNFVLKTKRSPSQSSPQNVQKSVCNQMHKTNSTSSCVVENKNLKSRLTSLSSTPASCNSSRTTPDLNTSLSHAEINKKVHLLQLLAQQEEEHRNLQKSFELQQKILIEQLSRELAAARLKSSNGSQHSSPRTPMSQHKKFDEQHSLPSRKFNNDNHALSKPTASSDLTRHKTRKVQHPSPHSISSNSSYIAFDNNNRHNQNSHQNPSSDSNFTQTTQPNSIHNSHSSVNNSLDISTLSMHTSPDTQLLQNNTAKNTTFNKTTPSFCRRLFTTEVNSETDEGSALSARSVLSTSCVPDQKSTEAKNQPQQLNYDSKIRVPECNAFVLHQAATKINAYARGFLVRRLFNTEQIQRIVQTIRDTLIFVLNLHIETIENPEETITPANIKLKARLLQQLTSACRTLHMVFFQISTKERMEIIARDRKRIKHKLMAMHHKR